MDLKSPSVGVLQVERLTYYKCKLCPAEIIFTMAGVNNHVKLVHNITIQG